MPATDDVAGIYAKGRVLLMGDPEGRISASEETLTVAGVRDYKGGLIVRFKEMADRNAAEAARGHTLLIRAEDVRPLDDGEFFLHDLGGLEVKTSDGDRVGVVTDVIEGGPGYFLAVDNGERELLIPFSGRLIVQVDVERGLVVIDPPPGLLDL